MWIVSGGSGNWRTASTATMGRPVRCHSCKGQPHRQKFSISKREVTPMHKRRAQISITRRRLVTAGRTGLLGLAGIAFVAAARTGTAPLTGEATQQNGKNGK